MTNSVDLEGALKKIGERVHVGATIENDPMGFVRDVHRQWKEEGRKSSGKPRHSDRFLDTCLREQGTLVRSLTPKLVGKTNIQPKDAEALLKVFLSRWPVIGDSEAEIEYKPLLEDTEIELVADYAASQIGVGDSPVSATEPEDTKEALPGSEIGAVITGFYEEADAVITVSPEHTLISKPKNELIGFRNLMDSFMTIERRDKKPRPLIWVLDLGDQRYEDLDARRKYLNVQSLMSRFKALKAFEERGSKVRWDWLQSRAVIVLLDMVNFPEQTLSNIGGRNRVLRPAFLPHNLTLSAVAPDWLASTEFRALYGRNLDQLDQRNFSVFFNACADWVTPFKWPETSDLRYFGYATIEDKDRGVELPLLPFRYAEGFRAVALASAHILGLNYHMPEAQTPEEMLPGEELLDQLHYLGFQILRLNHFLERY